MFFHIFGRWPLGEPWRIPQVASRFLHHPMGLGTICMQRRSKPLAYPKRLAGLGPVGICIVEWYLVWHMLTWFQLEDLEKNQHDQHDTQIKFKRHVGRNHHHTLIFDGKKHGKNNTRFCHGKIHWFDADHPPQNLCGSHGSTVNSLKDIYFLLHLLPSTHENPFNESQKWIEPRLQRGNSRGASDFPVRILQTNSLNNWNLPMKTRLVLDLGSSALTADCRWMPWTQWSLRSRR